MNTETGVYRGTVLYLDYQELHYLPGDQVKFWVAAPGYQAREITVLVQNGKNERDV